MRASRERFGALTRSDHLTRAEASGCKHAVAVEVGPDVAGHHHSLPLPSRPEMQPSGRWTANEWELQAATGGCGLMRWVCRCVLFDTGCERRRLSHGHAHMLVPRKRPARPAVEMWARGRRPRTMETHLRTANSHGHAKPRKRRYGLPVISPCNYSSCNYV